MGEDSRSRVLSDEGCQVKISTGIHEVQVGSMDAEKQLVFGVWSGHCRGRFSAILKGTYDILSILKSI